MNSIIVAPSILASDFGKLNEEIRRSEAAGADWHHMDIMDGHLVDNISFGPAFVEAAFNAASVPLDVHLMIERPDHYVPRFAPHAHNITVHTEAKHDVSKTLAAIRDAGCTRGLTFKPGTPFSACEPYLGEIDLLLIMTVEPGFGGQPFMIEMMEKVRAAAAYRAKHRLNFRIEVDGGINAATSAIAREAGADTLVAGTSVFRADDMVAAMRGVRGA